MYYCSGAGDKRGGEQEAGTTLWVNLNLATGALGGKFPGRHSSWGFAGLPPHQQCFRGRSWNVPVPRCNHGWTQRGRFIFFMLTWSESDIWYYFSIMLITALKGFYCALDDITLEISLSWVAHFPLGDCTKATRKLSLYSRSLSPPHTHTHTHVWIFKHVRKETDCQFHSLHHDFELILVYLKRAAIRRRKKNFARFAQKIHLTVVLDKCPRWMCLESCTTGICYHK